jgi:hypothetical protein
MAAGTGSWYRLVSNPSTPLSLSQLTQELRAHLVLVPPLPLLGLLPPLPLLGLLPPLPALLWRCRQRRWRRAVQGQALLGCTLSSDVLLLLHVGRRAQQVARHSLHLHKALQLDAYAKVSHCAAEPRFCTCQLVFERVHSHQLRKPALTVGASGRDA